MLEIGVNFSYTPIIPSHNIPFQIENKIEKKVKEGKEEKEEKRTSLKKRFELCSLLWKGCIRLLLLIKIANTKSNIQNISQ